MHHDTYNAGPLLSTSVKPSGVNLFLRLGKTTNRSPRCPGMNREIISVTPGVGGRVVAVVAVVVSNAPQTLKI